MAAKRVDPMKAKAAKQKKIAIGGTLLLVALLAIQGPKTMKLLQGSQPVAQPTATTPATPTSGTPVATPAAGTDTTGGTAAGEAPAAAADLASVPDSDRAPVVDAGQLATFERFSSKDPFAQQAEAVAAPTPAASETDPAADGSKPTEGDGTAVGPTDGGFTTGGTNPPAAQELATTTSVAINGAAEDVKLEEPFPAAEPTFVLVSVAADGKSVEIGVDGGEYANGGETLKLLLGKKITLQNTADGSRFELELLSIQGFPLPKQKG